MMLTEYLHSAGPVHGFALDSGQIVYGRLNRARDGLTLVERQPLPHGWFGLGPVGLLQIDRAALDGALSALIGRLDKPPSRVNLVVPNSWVRSLIVDVGGLPRARADADEMLRWKLKKLLPCRPEEVRLDFLPVAGDGRVWLVLALEKPLSAVEETFAARGARIGRIEPSIVALSALLPPASSPQLLVAVDARTFAVLLVVDGNVAMVRHKAIPGAAADAEAVVIRELAATVAHAFEREGVASPVELMLASPVEMLRDAVLEWARRAGSAVVHPIALRDPRLGPSTDVEPIVAWSLLAAGMRSLR